MIYVQFHDMSQIDCLCERFDIITVYCKNVPVLDNSMKLMTLFKDSRIPKIGPFTVTHS